MSKRLLLVDEDPSSVVLLESQLAPLGYQFIRAADGSTAMARFAELRPALVILDPVMRDGLELVRRIRAQSPASYLPIVLVSAVADREHRLRGLRAGADDFLERPIDGPVLRTRVRNLVELKDSRDVLRRLNAVLAVRNASLERLRREQQELMSFIAHDLDVPLTTIATSIAHARARRGDTGEIREALDRAADASRRLGAMIEDLLIVSRLEDSQFPVHLEPTPVSDLLREVIREYLRPAREKRVRLLEPPSPREDARVKTDRALLQRVIANLLDTSLRETPEHGRVGVEMRIGECVEIAVSNSGPPLPPPGSEPPARADRAADAGATARGAVRLGLYFCKRAMRTLGGDLEVTTTPDWPMSVIVRLPGSTATDSKIDAGG